MPRRYGWLRDYHHELDQGDERVLPDGSRSPRPAPAGSPNVNVTVNINLGDILRQIAAGDKSAKEALEEMIEESQDKEHLVEDEDLEDD